MSNILFMILTLTSGRLIDKGASSSDHHRAWKLMASGIISM